MSIEIERDIDGDAQMASFQNATLQSGPPGYEFSVAVHVAFPATVRTQDDLEAWLRRVFSQIDHDPYVSVTVQMGREGDGEVPEERSTSYLNH